MKLVAAREAKGGLRVIPRSAFAKHVAAREATRGGRREALNTPSQVIRARGRAEGHSPGLELDAWAVHIREARGGPAEIPHHGPAS